jgi:hypothetical protein
MLRQTLQTDAVKRLVDACDTQYPDGLVTKVARQGFRPASAISGQESLIYLWFCTLYYVTIPDNV